MQRFRDAEVVEGISHKGHKEGVSRGEVMRRRILTQGRVVGFVANRLPQKRIVS